MHSRNFLPLFLTIFLFACGGVVEVATQSQFPQLIQLHQLKFQLPLGVIENSTAVTSISANDAQGDAISYSVTGIDATFFSVTNTGTISFSSAPDFENPLIVIKVMLKFQSPYQMAA